MNRDELYQTCVLEQAELDVLLQGLGMPQYLGFAARRAIEDKPAALRTLERLAKKGVIVSDGSSFHVAQPHKAMVYRIGQAPAVLRLQVPDNRLPLLCCYPGTPVLVCEQTEQNPKMLRLSWMEETLLWQQLLESGYCPPIADDTGITSPVEEELSEVLSGNTQPASPLQDYEILAAVKTQGEIPQNALFMAQSVARTPQPPGGLLIWENGLNYLLCHARGSTVEWLPYDAAHLLQALHNMLEDGML